VSPQIQPSPANHSQIKEKRKAFEIKEYILKIKGL
jgi:hypothetical protein